MGLLGELFVAVRGETKSFDDAIDQSKTKAIAAQAKLQQVADKMSATGKKLTMFVSLPILAIGAAFVKSASDAEETNSKFDAVFKGQKDSVREWAKQFSTSVNRATIDNVRFLSSIQDTLVPLGFMREKATGMSKAAVELATDIASFNNLPTEQVMNDIISALVGNTEGVRKYGVVMNETILKQEAFNMGIGDGKSVLTAQAKASAVMSIMMKSTTDAQGDAIRTGDSFANQLKGLQATMTDLAEVWGQLLIPLAKELVKSLKGVAEWIRDLDEKQKKMVLTVAAFAAAAGPLLIIISKLVLAVKVLIPVLGMAKVAMLKFNASLVVNPIMLAVMALAALVAGIAILVRARNAEQKEIAETIRLVDISRSANDEETKTILENSVARKRNLIVMMQANLARMEELNLHARGRAMVAPYTGTIEKLKKKIVEVTEAFQEENERLVEHAEKMRTTRRELENTATSIDGLADEFEDLTLKTKDQKEAVEELTIASQDYDLSLDGINNTMLSNLGILAEWRSSWDKAEESIEDTGKTSKKTKKTLEEQLKEMKVMATYISGPFVDAYGTAFEAFGGALVEGGNALQIFRDAFKETIAGMLDMLAKWLVVKAIEYAIPWPNPFFNPAAAALSLLGAAASKTAAGAVRALSEGDDFIVPPGYPNDSYPMAVESGEHVQVTSARATRQGGQQRPGTMQGDVYLDSDKVGKWIGKISESGNMLLDSRCIKQG